MKILKFLVIVNDALLREALCGASREALRELGPVDIHRSQIMAPTRNSMDANESAVFS
jgi:hypothetical protein